MRNLKKVLALVLALVMAMSLVTVANAADFSDKADINYKEAVDVMNAIGVIDGLDTGAFNPKGTLTREQAAKIICTMMLGDSADKLGTSSSSFKDVAVTRWSSPYIEYCASIGIIAGNGDGTFNPTGKLTGHAFAKMLLGALGYNAATEGYVGAGWSIEVAKDAVSAGIDVDGVALSAQLTREQAAQMAFQTLEATMVEYATAGSSVVLPDGTQIITSGATASKVENDDKKAGYDGEADGYQQFCEEHFAKLTKGTGNDDAGRPGSKWSYDKKSVGTYGSEADYVVVLEKKYTADEVTNVEKTEKILQDLTGNDDLKFHVQEGHQNNDVNFWINGKDLSKGANKPSGEEMAKRFNEGSVLELFCDGDEITDIIVLDYVLGEIEDVSTNLTKAQKEDGATCKIKVDGKFYLDSDVVGFNADTYEEGTYILYTANENTSKNDILASQVAESIEGKVSAKRSGEVRIDGNYYTDVTGKISVGDEGIFYLNMAGQIEAVDTSSTASANYMYIYTMDSKEGTNSDGIKGITWTAYGVLADGTKVSYEVKADNGKFDGTNVSLEGFEGVIAYSINSNDQLVYKTAKDKIAKVESLTANEDNAAGTSSSTKFVFTDKGDSKVSVSVATGYKNVEIKAAPAWTVTNADGDIEYVFVATKNGSVTTDANLAVVLDADAIEEVNEDGDTVYTYVVAVDGSETELTFEDEQSFADGWVIAYEMDGDFAVLDQDATVMSGKKVTAATDDYFTYDGKQYNLGGDETVYTITMEYEDEAAYNAKKVDSVTVSEGGKIEKDDDVAFTLNKGDLDIVFVYEYIY